MVIFLKRGADLHMAQLMPLPLTVSASVKSRLVLPLWYRLTRVVPDKGPLNGCVCDCPHCILYCHLLHRITCHCAVDEILQGLAGLLKVLIPAKFHLDWMQDISLGHSTEGKHVLMKKTKHIHKMENRRLKFH